MIITLEDGSQIQQNVLELNDFQDNQLVEIHEQPIQIVKAESVEEEVEIQAMETSASRESPKKKMKYQPFKPKVFCVIFKKIQIFRFSLNCSYSLYYDFTQRVQFDIYSMNY